MCIKTPIRDYKLERNQINVFKGHSIQWIPRRQRRRTKRMNVVPLFVHVYPLFVHVYPEGLTERRNKYVLVCVSAMLVLQVWSLPAAPRPTGKLNVSERVHVCSFNMFKEGEDEWTDGRRLFFKWTWTGWHFFLRHLCEWHSDIPLFVCSMNTWKWY